jgi:hypothetical protein
VSVLALIGVPLLLPPMKIKDITEWSERFQLQRFTVTIKELAEWFGLEIVRIVVDECLAPPPKLPK